MRRRSLRIATIAVALSPLLVGAPSPSSSAASTVTYSVSSSGLPIQGHGYGNGIGLSQWGAYGAAKVDGLSAMQILNFYYPTTKNSTLASDPTVRVLLDSTSSTNTWQGVSAASGLTVAKGSGKPKSLPTKDGKATITAWRVLRSGTTMTLQEQTGSSWSSVSSPSAGATTTFADSSDELNVISSDAPTPRLFRGSDVVTLANGVADQVDAVTLDSYVDGVVPSEMPSSWSAAALQSQAVAARSYALYQVEHQRSSRFDLYGSSRDQAYGGVDAETTTTNNAVAATARQVRVDSNGDVIFAAYGAADGGYTVASQVAGVDVSYLVAKADPYDDLVPNDASAWTDSISRSALGSAFPSVGTPKSVTVDARDGNGVWGGRTTSITVIGSDGSTAVTGAGFAGAVGIRGPWWLPELPPGPVRFAFASTEGTTVSVNWSAPASKPGMATPNGYDVKVSPIDGSGPSKSIKTTAHIAMIDGMSPAASYDVTVRAMSGGGAGPPVEVSSAVDRAQPAPVSIGPDAAVLFETADEPDALGAPSLAVAADGPLLSAGPNGLSSNAKTRLSGLQKGATVYLVGSKFPSDVKKSLQNKGYSVVTITGSSSASTAAKVADKVLSLDRAAKTDVSGVIEADRRSMSKAALGASVAAHRSDVLLLTDNGQVPSATQNWLTAHPGIAKSVTTVGSKSGTEQSLSASVATRYFSRAVDAALIAPDDVTDTLLWSGNDYSWPVLIASSGGGVGSAVSTWLTADQAKLTLLSLFGPSSGLPYSDATAADGALTS